MIQIASFVFNPFSENTYVLYDETGEALIIDPGNYEPEENVSLEKYITDHELKPVLIANTHAHIDHVLGVSFSRRRWNLPFALHPIEEQVLRAVKAYAPSYGFARYEEPEIDQRITTGETIRFGNTELEVLFVPGHCPGHVAFYNREEGVLISGDVLFRESIGRTDLPGGNHAILMRSILEQLFVLPDEVKVYPGHGPDTTIGYEKRHNPFFYV